MTPIIKLEKKFNKSMVYLVPVFLDYFKLDKKYLENTYIFLNEVSEEPRILIKFKWNKELVETEKDIIVSPLYKQSFNPDGNSIVFDITIPEEFHEDFYKFINGQYSKLSPKLQKNIKRFWNTDSSSILYKILTKSEELKAELELELGVKLPHDAELTSKPNLKEEIYNEQQY